MVQLGLSQEEFQHIVHACQRLLINEFTATRDFQHLLVARLRPELPALAGYVARYDARQMNELLDEVAQALRLEAIMPQW